jgi:uncharacterized protein (DUF1501 family)
MATLHSQTLEETGNRTMTTMPRRRVLQQLLSAAALAPISTLSFGAAAAPTQSRRLVLVILRGGLDGLGAVPAPGDPSFADARGPLANFLSPPLPLGIAGGPFALHPSLSELHAMYVQGEALVVHATGLPYRDRSHFDAQQVLESGGVQPYQLSTGWLARALAPAHQRGIALNTTVPLVLRGSGEVDTWAPSALPDPSADLISRIERLYAQDADLARALARARGLRQDASMAGAMGAAAPGGARSAAIELARKAGEFIAQPNGPQVAVLEMNGWDTHANQAAPQGALANSLRTLDAALAALKQALSAPQAQGAWSRTVVAVVTEFGREVAVNGTLGTDHGSGGAAFVLGGAVRGGRVIADWPGLAKPDRHEGRDLRITTDLRAVMRGLLHDHLHVASSALDNDVFPGSAGLNMPDLVRS